MLISHSHKFVTIDIPKTGTRTMWETLNPLGILDIIGEPDVRADFYQHGTALQCKQQFDKMGWNWNSYTKFSFVRNPWKRYVSLMRYRIEKAKDYEKANLQERNSWPGILLHRGKVTSAWCKRWPTDKEKLQSLILSQSAQQSYLCDTAGECMIDLFGDTEKFYESFISFCDKVGISPVPKPSHGNKGTYTKPWRDYYDQGLIDMVAEKEKWVIELKSYSF